MADNDYRLSQTGQQVQDLLNSISDKVDKVAGKGLSTNDYDDTEKATVASAYQKPVTGIPAADLADGVIPDVSGLYTKPSGGIPSTDMSEAVQTSLGLADSALQSHQSVADGDPTLAWGTRSKVATIGSTEVHVTLPANPNTDTQADWNETDSSDPAYIKNKPTIPSGVVVDQTYDSTSTNAQSGVAIAGALAGKQDVIDSSHKLDYGLLSNTPTIPAAQVQTDWNATTGMGVLLNKPTIPDVSGKADKTSIVTNGTASQELENNTEYRYASATASLTISAPASVPSDYAAWLVFVSGSTATSLTYPSAWKWTGDDVNNGSFVPAASKTYNVAIWYDGVNINAIARGV